MMALISGCAEVGPGVSGVVDVAPATEPAVTLTYLGTGGWIMEHAGELLLTGPFFSNPSFVRVGLWPVASDTTLVDRYMGQYDVTAARAILVGHGHYDHLMDVPRVATHHAPSARIVGSPTVANALGTWSGLANRVDVILEEDAADQDTMGRWMAYGPRLRVMALRGHHAPHFDDLTLFKGTIDRPRTSEPANAREWLDGHTYAFLIDFLGDAGETVFRVYYQDAVMQPPRGLAPKEVIAERPVDVAIFVAATFDLVDWHPEAFVENLQAHSAIMGHWENFFVPMEAPTAAIGMSDMAYFQGRLSSVLDGEWWRPEIGTVFHFPATPSGPLPGPR